MIQFTLLSEQLNNAATLVLSVCIGILIIKLTSYLVRRHFEGQKDRAHVKEMVSIYQYAVAIIVIFVLIVIFSDLFKNVLASVGILAAGLAIALQKPIMNFFGWITIVLKKPYAIGDRVSIGSNRGDVFDINIMHTSMAELQDDSPSGRMIAVPNELVLTQPITNYTKGTPYVWDMLSVVVDKDSDEHEAESIVKKATDQVVGGLMADLSKRWTRADHRKVNVKPEVNMEISVVNGLSAIQLTSRYLCNVREKKSVRSQISNLIIDYIKQSKGVRLK
ncbi:mechanosensitive ion channel [Candidatus Woesearchaeota archaeon]|nr:mechanosensitive ion channel [Candidatus Woesearchaeota archaeon]